MDFLSSEWTLSFLNILFLKFYKFKNSKCYRIRVNFKASVPSATISLTARAVSIAALELGLKTKIFVTPYATEHLALLATSKRDAPPAIIVVAKSALLVPAILQIARLSTLHRNM